MKVKSTQIEMKNIGYDYKLYLFGEKEKRLGGIILFRGRAEDKKKLNNAWGITIIKGLQKGMGVRMMESVLKDTPEGILPSPKGFISDDAKKLYLKINNLSWADRLPLNKNDFRHDDSERFLDYVYVNNNPLIDIYENLDLSEVNELTDFLSVELKRLGYNGTSTFVDEKIRDVSAFLLKNKSNIEESSENQMSLA